MLKHQKYFLQPNISAADNIYLVKLKIVPTKFSLQISIEDVMEAIHLKSFDYRVLNLMMYRLTGQQVYTSLSLLPYRLPAIVNETFSLIISRSMTCTWSSCLSRNFQLRYVMTCEYTLNHSLPCTSAMVQSLVFTQNGAVHVLKEYLAHLICLIECSREVVYVCKKNCAKPVTVLKMMCYMLDLKIKSFHE